MFYLIKQHPEAAKDKGFQTRFFEHMIRFWKREPGPGERDWLGREVELWLGRAAQAPRAVSGVAPAREREDEELASSGV
jgi:hypothetical protein